MFGLRHTDVIAIKQILNSHVEVDTALIFGSRAKGNYKKGSDVDLALKGETLSFQDILILSYKLNEETLMPYHFDVVNYHEIDNKELRAHIDRVGVEIYSRNKIGIIAEPNPEYNKDEPPK